MLDAVSRIDLMDWISGLGTVAFTFSGYLVGVKKRLDLLGILIVALLTAIGGGIIRDVMVHRVPLVFYDYTNVVIISVTLLLSWIAGLHRRESPVFHKMFIIADSLGLVAFSITGAQVGLMFELNAFGVVLLGFITAVGGGVVRDMMVNDVPFILHEDFYGTVAILVAGGLFVLDQAGRVNLLTLWSLFWVGMAVRMVAHWRELTLPKIGQAGDKG